MLPGNNVPVDSKTDENSPTHDIENETTLASTPHKKRRIENLNDDDTKDEKKEDVTQALISHKEQKIDNASQDEIKDTPWYFCKSNHFPKPVKTIAELSYDLQKDILLNSEKYLSEDDTVDDANVTLWFWDSFILSPWEKQQQYTLNINNDQINELIDAGMDVSTDIDDHGNMLADALLFTHDSNGKNL